MRFSSTAFTAIAALSATAYAQDAAQLSELSSQLEAYVTATLIKNPAFSSDVAAIETDPAAVIQLLNIENDPAAILTGGASVESQIINALPTQVQALATSVFAVASSLATSDGILTATSSSDKAKATSNGAARDVIEKGLLGSLLLGVMGIMVAL